MNRSVAIGIGVLVLILGMVIFGEMTGNIITGASVKDVVVEDDYFRVDGSCNYSCENGSELNESLGGDLDG